jgi:hypothetical protein
MKLRISLILGVSALAALLLWVKSKPPAATPAAPKSPVAKQAMAPAPEATKAQLPSSLEISTSQLPAAPEPRTEESRASSRRDFTNPLVAPSFQETPTAQPQKPSAATEVIFDQITVMFRDYRKISGDNPTGTNAEMMKAIMGGNPKGAMLGPPEGQMVNAKGELLDPWGTPYFFHQLSRDVIEIHSAGPDQKLWNEDDIVSQ